MLLGSAILTVLGVLILLLGLGAALAAGGVPYPDGPNAGYTSPPGWRRALETFSFPAMSVGAVVLAAGLLGVLCSGPPAMVARMRRGSTGA